jgi:hypothetical protein
MKRTVMSTLRNERGIAMMTVMLVGAALTVVTTTAAVLSVRGLRATSADGQSAKAMAAAEAGLERFMLEVKKGSVPMSSMTEAGCASPPVTLPPGTLGPGSYNVALTIYEPTQSKKVPDTPWQIGNDDVAPCKFRSSNMYAITATGTQGNGTRVVRQLLRIIPGKAKFPLGIYAEKIDANGNPVMRNISVFTAGDLVGRGKIAMSGTDDNYTMKDVYNQSAFPTFAWSGGLNWDSNVPAAVHATGEIYVKGANQRGREHPFSSTQSVNCTANDTRPGTGGYALQSEWDGSACSGCNNSGIISADTCGGLPGYPPTARFTQDDMNRIAQVRNLTEDEYSNLKTTAQASGIYCNFASTVNQCWRAGLAGAVDYNWATGDLPTGSNSLVAYFDFPYSSNLSGNLITWSATWKAISGVMCNATNPADNKSVVIIVRNGNFHLAGTAQVTGAVIVPEGDFDSTGTPLLHGSVTARSFRVRGNATFESSTCFANSLPSTSGEISPAGWMEVDR